MEEFRNEVEQGDARDCNELEPDLMRRVIDFNKELKAIKLGLSGGYPPRTYLYLRLVSCYRDSGEQQKMHYARMIDWGPNDIQQHVKSASVLLDAQWIYDRSLKRLGKLVGSSDVTTIKEKAGQILEKKEVGKDIPVLPGVNNCPCDCCWPISKHTLKPAQAIDANVKANADMPLKEWRPVIVGSSSSPGSDNLTQDLYDKINKATTNNKLIWGINFKQIPVDPIHWELTDKTFDSNPGPLDAWILRSKSLNGLGPLVVGIHTQGGDWGNRVNHLQQMLKELKYPLGNWGPNKDGIDGKFGEDTKKAVISFQNEHQDCEGNKLGVDGAAGVLTADSLNTSLVGHWYNSYCTPRIMRRSYDKIPHT